MQPRPFFPFLSVSPSTRFSLHLHIQIYINNDPFHRMFQLLCFLASTLSGITD